MPPITFDLPEGALSVLHSQRELSQSKAADIAVSSRAEFIDDLARRRIPVVVHSAVSA